MLFNSVGFLFLFLPIVFALFVFCRGLSWRASMLVLIAGSLVFYGWANPPSVFLILASVGFNYGLGRLFAAGSLASTVRKWVLTVGIGSNLALLGYFKYADFFLENVAGLIGIDAQPTGILLPLAISFFTFQQIAYVVDAYRGECGAEGLVKYSCFICFFPQLIAGPIVRHDEFLGQLGPNWLRRSLRFDVYAGLSMFALGLFKKTVLADSAGPIANAVFAIDPAALTPLEAWIGTFAFSFQIYFDFSGYSDMAIGLARCFGIVLPMNFDSPYKSTSIAEFWRRWHMTLSRFLRDYLYISLGGNRRGFPRQLANLMVVMLLGGLWHGAGWGFVIWGGLHGTYLSINHLWRRFAESASRAPTQLGGYASRLLTLFAVSIAWVFFRAESATQAFSVIGRMLDLPELAASVAALSSPSAWELGALEATNWSEAPGVIGLLVILAAIVSLLPSSQLWLERFDIVLRRPIGESTHVFSARAFETAALAVILVLGILAISNTSEFIYFRF